MAYVGNFGPAHSTENDVAAAWNELGHRVLALQENHPDTWRWLLDSDLAGVDLFMWTRTWHLPQFPQLDALARLTTLGVPTVGYHLDRWWGLDREHQIRDEPFFRCDLMVTADGGHDRQWANAGIDHMWLPPAVNAGSVGRARVTRGAGHDVVFVGSNRWYHPEWPHRFELLEWLRRNYGRRFGVYPNGRVAVRGTQLAALYAGCKVAVGDSCLAGGATRYCSDRIPETLARGCLLIHPHVDGITDGTHYTPGEHLDTWPLGDWDTLGERIEHYLTHPHTRQRVADQGMAHVATHHTYTRRMTQVLTACAERGILAPILVA